MIAESPLVFQTQLQQFYRHHLVTVNGRAGF